MSQDAERTRPRLLRRLLAVVYDLLLLLAVWFVAALPWPLLPSAFSDSGTGRLLLRAYLILVAFLFFGGFWVHGGQTLGMRAWRVKLVSGDGAGVTWAQAARRFAAAILSAACVGLGFLSAAVRRDRLAWHDRLSGTRLVLLPKDPPRGGPGPS